MIFLNKKSNKGFGLVELILYIAIVSLLFLTMMSFISTVTVNRNRDVYIANVDSQGSMAMDKILQYIRNADSASSPSVGNNGSSLDLQMPDAALDPVEIDLNSNAIRVDEDNDGPWNLTADNVVVEDLDFYNLKKTDGGDLIRVSFTIHNASSTRRDYDYSKTFYGSASIRDYD